MAVVAIGNYDQVRGESVYLAYNSRLPFITEESQGMTLKTDLLALYSTTIPPNQRAHFTANASRQKAWKVVQVGTGKLALNWLSCIVSGPQRVETYIN